MKEILITNDDGFEANGLLALAEEIKKIPDTKVIIVAPKEPKSGTSHAITITKPLKIKKITENFYNIDDATPADCVLIALDKICKPDLILSGINYGGNLAEDITYSGTCGAAIEGVLHGIFSVAFSQVYFGDSFLKFGFNLSAKFSRILVEKILNNPTNLVNRRFLNVNFPPCDEKSFKGFVACEAGFKDFKYGTKENFTPKNESYLWLDCDSLIFDENKNVDKDLGKILQNYATITPITTNFTDFSELEKVKEWLK